MLTATDARNASVHGRFRKPSTNRSEVVKPTSKRPPTISHNQGMKILSLDAARPSITLVAHEEAADHRQHDRASALPCVHRDADHCRTGCSEAAEQPAARVHGSFRPCRAFI